MAASNKGKFSERLKRILFFKRKKPIVKDDIELEDSNKIYTNFLKVVAAIPGLVYGNIIVDNSIKKDEKVDDKGVIIKNEPTNVSNDNTLKYNLNNNSLRFTTLKNAEKRKTSRKLIDAISIDEIKNKPINSRNEIGLFDDHNNTSGRVSGNNDLLDNRVKELEKSIINLIKKDLIKVVNEMEILQSELYILSEVNGDSRVLSECQEELDNVKSMLCKIDKLKEQYDFLKDNYDFEYLLEIDNTDLVDKIIELKDLCGSSELKAVSDDYKLLEVYKYLYLKIDDLQDKMVSFEDKKQEECEKLKERDIDFEQLKRDVYSVEHVKNSYESFINNQNELLKEIDNNVNKINSYEQVDYHLEGFGKLFMNSFKYFGLLMVSPLKGIIPSIATETLLTMDLIKNLRRKLEWKETRTMVYEAMDYASIINNAISDLDGTSRIVDATLEDIVQLKMKYNDQFKQYQGDFLEYREIMHKINDMENKILGNKIKVEMMKKRALEQKKENEKKLKLVKELNSKEVAH